jgi:cytidine deaminase
MDEQQQRALLDLARAAATRAYVPYSTFPVGAAVLTADGSVFTGCNIENASYSLVSCGERSAVFAAVSAGHRELLAVAVSAPKAERVTPCGACRQVLNEFRPAVGDLLVILDDGAAGEPVPLSDLLPRSFGSRDLGGGDRAR